MGLKASDNLVNGAPHVLRNLQPAFSTDDSQIEIQPLVPELIEGIEYMQISLARLDGANHEKAPTLSESREMSCRLFRQAARRSGVVEVGAQVKPAYAERPLTRRIADHRPITQIVRDRSGNAQRPIRFEQGTEQMRWRRQKQSCGAAHEQIMSFPG